jgi:DNA-binding SARP family transcriptional activator
MAARHATPTPPKMRRGDKARGTGALLLLLVLLAGIPAVLITVTGTPFAHGLPSWSHLTDRLRSPDDGQLLLDVLLILAWAGWAAFTASAVAEMLALARHTVAPALFGLSALQPAASRLLASAAMLLPASGAVLHLGAGAVHTPLPVTAPLRPAATATSVVHRPAATPPRPVGPAAQAVQAVVVLPVYVVGTDHTGQRDTLWSIAARHLGNPLRWHDIAQLNYGHTQADGGTFTDPNLIRPGWQLQLPADATGLPRNADIQPAAQPAPANHPATATPSVSPPPAHITEPPLPPVPAPVIAKADPTPRPKLAHAPAPTPMVTNSPASTPPATAQPPAVAKPDTKQRPTGTVSIGPGSEIGAALAAAVLLLLNLRRVRRRRRYQPRPPRPAAFGHAEPLPPVLRQLIAHSHPTGMTGESADTFLAAITAIREWELAARDDRSVTIPWTEHPVLSLAGDGAADVARAIITSALLDHPGSNELVTVGDSYHGLFHGLAPAEAVVRLPGLSAAAELIHREVLSRSRRLADADLPDAAAYRTANPEDPFPALLLFADQPLDAHPALAGLLSANAHLDIAALILNDPAAARSGHVDLWVEPSPDGDRFTVHAQPLAEQLAGTRLLRLTPAAAKELLTASLAAADDGHDGDERHPPVQEKPVRTEPAQTERVQAEPARVDPVSAKSEDAVAEVAAHAVDWVATTPSTVKDRPPIRVALLGNGPMRIWLRDIEITAGLRGSARELLAWYLLHPEGRTIDMAVTALWPDTPPDRVSPRFWTALGNLRTRLANPDRTKLAVLSKTAGGYQPQSGAFDVDLWAFQAALQHAAEAADDAAKIGALRVAVNTYRGPFAPDADYLWADPIREELHGTALDAHVAYADLVAGLGGQDQAIATLERARRLDPYAEDIYRRLMRLHHDVGRKESALLLWKQLNIHLADIDADPDPETTRLYRRIRGLDNGRPPARGTAG